MNKPKEKQVLFRMTEDMHTEIKIYIAKKKITFQKWITECMEDSLKKVRRSEK